jgi:hypothetical protein
MVSGSGSRVVQGLRFAVQYLEGMVKDMWFMVEGSGFMG